MSEIEGLQERLREGEESFKKAPADGGFSTELPPDGEYQAVVKKFDFFESKKSGDAFLKTVLEIAFDREWQGTEVETIHNLTDPEVLESGWLKTHLKRLGADVDELELSAVSPGSELLGSLLDVPVAIAIKTSDRTNDQGEPYRNVYLNKRLGDPLQGGSTGVAGGPMEGGKVQAPESEVPADEAGLDKSGTGAESKDDEEIPFARPRVPDLDTRRRNLFVAE